jgi:hypothetical protein
MDPQPTPEQQGHPRSSVSVEQLLVALRKLGVEPCVEHAPGDPEQQAAGLLGALLAAAQWHMQATGHRDQVDVSYHLMRAHLGFPPCTCGSRLDEVCDDY